MSRSPRRLLERLLDLPQRAALSLPWPPNGRIAVAGLFGFLKQAVRSRGTSARPAGPDDAAAAPRERALPAHRDGRSG